MKNIALILTLLVMSHRELKAQALFVPEIGAYKYNQSDVNESFKSNGLNYVSLREDLRLPNYKYKLVSKNNEYQIQNWFQRDWFELQDMFSFDIEAFIRSEKTYTFNEAKRLQFSKFIFNKKGYYHHKTVPTMKEWGGLTHPPVKKLTLPLAKYDANFGDIDYSQLVSPYFGVELQNEIDSVSKSELTFGNKLTALADNKAFLLKKKLIKNARESILMSSLVFVCDESTLELTNLLIEKHRQGVLVKIITDGVIGKIFGHQGCINMMKTAGIEVILSRDFLKHKRNTIYHTKTLVTDLTEAIAGGHNMLNADNLSRSTDFSNRDIDLYVKGPMVTDIAKQFVENWSYQTTLDRTHEPLSDLESIISSKRSEERSLGQRGAESYKKILTDTQTRMQGVCRFVKQAPYEDRHTIGKTYLKLLSKVSRHLVITDPLKTDTLTLDQSRLPLIERFDNFEMYNLLHSKVQMLARAGKKIDYITTNINMAGNENVAILNEKLKNQLDHGKELQATWSVAQIAIVNDYYGKPHYTNLMNDWLPFPNVHIWTNINFMHSKIFYFDRVAASVGSYNFQHNATDHSYESTAVCMDEKLNKELDQLLVEDMANSIPLIFSELR